MKVAIVGGGVVGLAVARSLATAGHDVAVIERHSAPGKGITSRSSEVVHAGIYYPPGSLKARLCVAGREALLALCSRRSVALNRCGKLIVACSDDEVPALEGLLSRSRENAVNPGLQRWSAAEAHARFPAVRAVAALWSPGTAVVDSHALVRVMAAELQRADGALVLGAAVVGIQKVAVGWRLRIAGGGGEERHTFDAVVNAAGLGADAVATMAGVIAPRTIAVKGSYFRWASAPPVGTLVYPVPSPSLAGLGVHLTIGVSGAARLGPDVELGAAPGDHAVDPARAELFAAAARRFLPAITADQLRPDFAGIRPKLAVDRFADFHIEPAAEGFVQLSGIESPGLTASLAIGDRVRALLDGDDPDR